MDDGICYIKPEYLVTNESLGNTNQDGNTNKRKFAAECEDVEADSTRLNKSVKFNKKDRKRGQNKERTVFKEDKNSYLCNSLVNGPGLEECNKENCRFVHDLDYYLANKPADIDETCPIFTLKGFCPRGLTCRFSKMHIDKDKRNIKASHYNENAPVTTINGINSNIQFSLRKYQFDFTKSDRLMKFFEDYYEEKIRSEAKAIQEVVPDDDYSFVLNTAPPVIPDFDDLPNSEADSAQKPIGSAVDDDETNGRDKYVKPKVDFRDKIILSPLTTVGNLPFRRICKEFGADITCGEMACALPILKGVASEWALTKRHVSEDIFGVQICGTNIKAIVKAAQLLQESVKIDFIDLNVGCPIDLIYHHGGGCALMRRSRILEIVTRCCAALNRNIPFTVKMRTGIYADQSIAHQVAPLVEECGAAAVTIHGRSREQRYMKYANWKYIEEVASKIKNIPVIGNGDIFSFEDFKEKKKIAPHVSSVMIGRGALIKPWIFKELKEEQPWDPSSSERFEIIKKYVEYGLEHWGSDTKGVENTRRFLLEWQSFLYRYVPFGLIANPPHKINQRPQKFRGRDEMETLMSSPNASDWVKISEMLLGPVPNGFTFVPKHKANSY